MDALEKFEVSKSMAGTIGRAAGHIERLTPKIQQAGKGAQSWRDGIHGLPTDHPAKKEVVRLLDATAKLTAGRKYKAPTTVEKFEFAKAVSTKLRASAQQSQDQSQMMAQAMQEATAQLAPKVAMEVERIRAERAMQMQNDQMGLQNSGPQVGPAGPSGPQQYTGGPAMTGAQVQGPQQVTTGPQTYS